MNPEHSPSPADNLSKGEWRLLAEHLPAMIERSETGIYRRVSGAVETLVLPLEHGGSGSSRYYIYRAESEDALTMYDVDSSSQQLHVYDQTQFGYLRNMETAGANFEFDAVVDATAPNAQNLAGLRVFLRDIQDEEDFLQSI